MSTSAEQEFVAFVRASQHRLLRAAYLVCGDHHTAQDLLQEAYAKTASRWAQVSDGAPEAYIRRILYRDAVSRWRKVGREQPMDMGAPDSIFVRMPSSDDPTSWVDRAQVRVALDQLPPRQRAVLVLRYYEDLSEEQIADLLGIRPGAVKSQASRALAHLRRLLPELAPALAGEGGDA
jgi:RNA polymerase sigma-70 factor (sigma-E family)